ncbi:MAG: xylulokinase [Planctomycetota bacterium]
MFDGLYLGIDCGTQGLKTLLFDGATGAVVALAKRNYEVLPNAAPGVSEQNPNVWIAAAEATIREVVRAAGKRSQQIKAVAVSGQQHGMVAIDKAGKPVRAAKLWNDVSTANEAAEIINKCGGASAMLKLTGNALPPGFTGSKVYWLERNEPRNYERCVSILLPHDYINFWLTGEKQTEAGDASGTGYFNINERNYSRRAMDAISDHLYQKVPPVAAAGAVVGEVRESLTKKFGLPRRVAVGHGGGDNMMAAFGTGATREGIITISLGTSGTAFGYSNKPVVDRFGEIAAFCDSSGGYLPLLCIQNCTNVTESVKRLLQFDDRALDAAATKAKPGSDGMLLLPFFSGERTPNLPSATAAFVELTHTNFSRENMARAAMEAPAVALAFGLNRLRELGMKPTEIRATGGGSKSKTWRKILANALGAPIVNIAAEEGAALGAALCALWCSARETNRKITADEVCSRFVKLDPKSRAAPDPETAGVYQEMLDRRNRYIQTMYSNPSP